jgi:hypothetical protein
MDFCRNLILSYEAPSILAHLGRLNSRIPRTEARHFMNQPRYLYSREIYPTGRRASRWDADPAELQPKMRQPH